MNQTVTVIALILFCGMMIAIGFYSRHKTKTMDGFLLGGRKIGAWMSAFAYGTSYFSAVIFIGYAGKQGWDIGFASMWIGVGNALLGCFLAWKLLAKKTRTMTHNLNAKTMPEFFEARYNSSPMKLFGALLIFIFLVPYSSAVYKGLGSLFNTIFPNVSVNVCMLIVACITAVFLVLGGYVATVYTDFVQGIIMIVGVIIMVCIITFNPMVGGLGAAVEKINSYDSALTSLVGGSNWSFLLTNILLTSFGTWGLPQMINKYYAVSDEAAIKKATVVSTIFAGIIGVGAYYVGSLGRIFLNNNLPEKGYDAVVPQILITSLGSGASVIVLAIILILLLSASMSTLSAIVLASASAVSVDFLPMVMKSYEKHKQMYITRLLCFVFVGLSYIFASLQIGIIVSIMSFSWGAVSGTFIGPYIWGLYSKKITKYGAWAGMLGGFLTVILLTVVTTMTAGFPQAMAKAPVFGVSAMGVSIILTPLVSIFTKPLDTAVIKKAFEN